MVQHCSLYFCGSQDHSLHGLAWLPKQTLYTKVMTRGQLNDLEQNGITILTILNKTVWDFAQAKCSLCWWIEKCDSLLLSNCLTIFLEDQVKKIFF